MIQDVRFALRSFLRNPGFTLVVSLSIALGIAGNTTVFTIVNAVFLGALPVPEPDRLLSFDAGSMSHPDYLDYRDQTTHVFQGVAAHFPLVPVSLAEGGPPERIWGQMVSGNYFSVVGVRPALGRGLTQEDFDQRSPVVVLSHGLWKRRFGGDPHILGRPLAMNNRGFTVVGVTPRGYDGTDRGLTVEFWIPLSFWAEMMPDLAKDQAMDKRNYSWLSVTARLKPGADRRQAQAAVSAVQIRLHDTYRKSERPGRPISLATAGGLPREFKRIAASVTTILMIVVGLVLLIACANVANLLLARAAARQKEIGIRLAIGAGRGRLLRQMLTESVLLSVAGAAGGFLLALAAIRALDKFELPLPLPIGLKFTPDLRVFAFTAGLAVVTGILFGLAPALRSARQDLVAAIKGDSGSLGLQRRFSLRNGLVVVQVTLSLVLLIGATLFLRSLANASLIELGLNPDNLLLMGVDPKLHHYSPERTRQFVAQLRQRVSALPGVTDVSFVDSIPLSIGGSSNTVRYGGDKAGGEKEVNAHTYRVGARFFECMGIPLRRGRAFRLGQDGDSVALINETLARRLFDNQDALGRRVRLRGRAHEIIGIAANHKSRTLGEENAPVIYQFLEADPEQNMSFFGIVLVVKTAVPPAAMSRAVRGEIEALDRNLPVFGVETMREHVNKLLLIPRVCASLLGVFGAVGLTLAAVGLYGVMSYSVRRRTREIGIRMALGQEARGVLGLVSRQGLALAASGLALGLALSAALTRFLASQLYGVSVTDTLTFIAVPLLLLAVAAIATLIPARRAARIDPIQALRYE